MIFYAAYSECLHAIVFCNATDVWPESPLQLSCDQMIR